MRARGSPARRRHRRSRSGRCRQGPPPRSCARGRGPGRSPPLRSPAGLSWLILFRRVGGLRRNCPAPANCLTARQSCPARSELSYEGRRRTSGPGVGTYSRRFRDVGCWTGVGQAGPMQEWSISMARTPEMLQGPGNRTQVVAPGEVSATRASLVQVPRVASRIGAFVMPRRLCCSRTWPARAATSVPGRDP